MLVKDYDTIFGKNNLANLCTSSKNTVHMRSGSMTAIMSSVLTLETNDINTVNRPRSHTDGGY